MIIPDSSFWVSLFDESDSYHAQARTIAGTLIPPIWLHEYVLIETATVLAKRQGKEVTAKFILALVNNRDVILFPVSKEVLTHITKRYLTLIDKNPSFVDVALIHASEEHEIITFDKDLDKEIKSLKKK